MLIQLFHLFSFPVGLPQDCDQVMGVEIVCPA